MKSLDPILKNWERYYSEKDLKPNDDGYIIKWCESLMVTLESNDEDLDFKSELISAAIDYFDKLPEQSKRDAFFYLLGVAVRK